jgi:hypothetical protein
VTQKSRIRALRQAQLYGYLIDRTGRLYYPGGSHPVCSVQIAHEMIRRDTRYEITREGLRVLALEAHSHMRADA